jgi:hypothetical protein
MVLGEEFTNTGCPPCPNASNVLDNIYSTESDNFSIVSYHAWWPNPNDPYYQYNTSENGGRINYYGADYTPHLWIDGDVDAGSATYQWQNRVTSEESVSSPIAIDLKVTYDNTSLSGTINAVISATEAITHTNLYVRFAIIESDLPPVGYYSNPINFALRDMVTNITGQSLTISQGDVVTKSTNYTLDPIFVFDNVDIVVFVQSDTDHHVLQAARYTLSGPGVTISPSDATIQVPRGGTLNFDTFVENNSNNEASGDFWLSVRLPNGNEVVVPEANLNYPNPQTGTIPSWGSFDFPYQIYIPSSGIPTGIYTLIGHIGIYPNTVLRESSFDFEITP